MFLIDPGEGPEQWILAEAPIDRVSPDDRFAIVNLDQAYYKWAEGARRGFALLADDSGALIRDQLTGATPGLPYLWMGHVPAALSARFAAADRSAVVLEHPNGERLLVYVVEPGFAFRAAGETPLLPAQPLPTSPNPPGQASNEGFRKLVLEGNTTEHTAVTVVLTRLESGAPERKPDMPDPRTTRPLPDW